MNAPNATPGASDTATLTVRELHVQYGNTQVLRGVTLHANVGEICAVMGATQDKATAKRRVAHWVRNNGLCEVLADLRFLIAYPSVFE